MRGKSFILVLCTALFVLALCASAWADSNLLVNGNFEDEVTTAGGMPPGWPSPFSAVSTWGQVMNFTDQAFAGNRAITINDLSDKNSYGLRSAPVPAVVGHEYRVQGRATNAGGVYLEFWDAKGTRIANKSAKAATGSAWSKIEVTYSAPENTVTATVLVYSFIPNTGECKFDDLQLFDLTATPEALADTEGEMSADAMQLDYKPAEGALVTTNPASFVWIPVAGTFSYQLEVSTSADFEPAKTQTFSNIDISIYTPEAVMDAVPTYFWRVRGLTKGGTPLPWSAVRSFRYDRNAALMPLPNLATVKARIPSTHPRLYVRPETLQAFRDLRNSLTFRIIGSDIHSKAIGQSVMDLPKEPVNCRPGGKWDVDLWRQGMNEGTTIMGRIENMAFDYLLTGNENVGKAVRSWMLTVASWDPKGATSAAINDEISMPILYIMSRAYTWAYDALSPEDREIIRNNIRIRATESYKILRNLPFESKPFHSHAGRQLGFLGEAAMAFMGEIPEAAEWFDYVLRIYFAVYPAWGSDPGGWAEGQAYWTSYINRVMWYADALNVATGLNLYDKPFFKNNGYFKLYTQPPYSKIGPFGDFAADPPSSTAASIMSHYADMYKNPYFKWYAMQLGGGASFNPMMYVHFSLASMNDVEAKAPSDLPQSRYFADIGWVAMHRNLADKNENIQFMLKSSLYGSVSHSLADQNSFTLEAFGEPLAISSGYRPWYGSNHHLNWTKQTKAHNSVLIGGQGQPIQSISAKGTIRYFVNGNSFDYTVGDAHEAYPNAARFLRHVVYVRPNVFVMFDDVAAKDKPVTYDWLLHTYQQMQIDATQNTITVPGNNASLLVQFYTPQSMNWAQTNEFEVPLDQPMNKPVQWHLKATTTTPATEQVFLTTLVARKTGTTEPAPTTVQVAVENGYGVKVQDAAATATVLFRKENSSALLKSEGIEATAMVAAAELTGHDITGVLMIAGTGLQVNGTPWLSTTQPVQAEVSYAGVGAVGSVTTAAPAQVLVRVNKAATQISMDGVTRTLTTKEVNGQYMAVLDLAVPGTYAFTIE